jgi:transcriptional regulator GlxA family with amidase domain
MDEYAPTRAILERLTLAGWGTLIVMELFRHAGARKQLVEHPIDPLVSKLLDKLHEHSSSDLTLTDLAHWSGFTPQHVNRLFRKELGVTPLQYHARLRLELAAGLLVEGRLTVQAIARQLAFEDPYYFSRAFRRQFGRSPAQNRQDAGSKSPSEDSADPFHAEPDLK